jgi:hypothetical protein
MMKTSGAAWVISHPMRALRLADEWDKLLAAAPPGVSRVYVVENEITYLAFPLSAQTLVIWGRGYAVDALAPLRWLNELDAIYWGDIDTHGFAILSRLRGMFPGVRSMLMDRVTLLAHREQWVRERGAGHPGHSRVVAHQLISLGWSLASW